MGVEDDDAPKFVTHWKGARNKNTNPNKDNSRALIDNDASDSDDDEGLFGFPGSNPLIANIGLSDSGINKIQANDDDEVNGRCSEIYGNTSILPESNESFEWMGISIQRPPKGQVTTKRAKKEKAVTLVTCHTVPPEDRMEPKYYCLTDIWGKYMRKVTLPLKYGPPPPVKGTDQRGERRGQILTLSNVCLTQKNEKSEKTVALHRLQGQKEPPFTPKRSTYKQNYMYPLGPPRRYAQGRQRHRA
jgi:hypothetical protein